MDERAPGERKEDIDLKYEGPLPSNDFLSYTKMAMEMNHSAMTNESCLSLAVMALFALGLVTVISIVVNTLFLR